MQSSAVAKSDDFTQAGFHVLYLMAESNFFTCVLGKGEIGRVGPALCCHIL